MRKIMAIVLLIALLGMGHAQQPQIPTLQVCNPSQVKGSGDGQIGSRASLPAIKGTFSIKLEVVCDPTSSPYPTGSLSLNINMNDSWTGTIFISPDALKTSFDQLTTTGKSSPTAYLTGRCTTDAEIPIKGCRIWLLLADNRSSEQGTPDVVSFLVFDGTGVRKAYGTAALKSGDIKISPTSF